MNRTFFTLISRIFAGAAVVLGLTAGQALANAEFVIVNNNAPGIGFNDPTPATPVGGNAGTTLGEQRLIAYRRALDLWGSVLKSDVTIYVIGTFGPFDPSDCDASGGVLASAGALQIFANFPNAPKEDVWYGVALANALAGEDLAPGDPESDIYAADIVAQFNGGIGTPNCIANSTWYYGLDNNAPSGVDAQGRPRMFAPGTYDGGSSVSHWDVSLFANQLMEPDISGDLIHSVAVPADLTGSQLRDVGWAFNPVGDVNFFVRQHYLDFLNREPDANGLAFWRDDVFGCGVDKACAEVKRVNVSAAFFLSIEFQQTGNLVYKMHKAGFGNLAGQPVAVRRADFLNDVRTIGSTPAQVIVGQGDWERQLEANKQAFALAFVQRPAFQSAHGGQSAADYVDSLFANVGVQPAAAERQAAVAAFGGGGASGQAAALRSVTESNSATAKTFNEAFVLMQYFGYLQRDPDAAPDADFGGYNFWLSKLNEFNGNFIAAEMVKAFITSTEYMDRFGSRL